MESPVPVALVQPGPKTIIKRTQIFAQIDEIFDAGTRFVCLTAPYGRGTSTIARVYAESIAHEYPGGIIHMTLPYDPPAARVAKSRAMHPGRSPDVDTFDVGADALVILDTGLRYRGGGVPTMEGRRQIITTHIEMRVPTFYTYQVPRLDEEERHAMATSLGLSGPLVCLAAGEPLAYVLAHALRKMDSDDERLAHAVSSLIGESKTEELHQAWLTPIAAFFSVWWSYLPERTRRLALALAACPPSGVLSRARAERFANMGDSFDEALDELIVARLVARTQSDRLEIQPALVAWLEKDQRHSIHEAIRRAEQAQTRMFCDLASLERAHTAMGIDALLVEMSALKFASDDESSKLFHLIRKSVERAQFLFAAPQIDVRPPSFLQFVLNQAVRHNNLPLRDQAVSLLEQRADAFLQERFATGSSHPLGIMRARGTGTASYSMGAGHRADIRSFASSARCLVSVAADGMLLQWDVSTGACLGVIDSQERALRVVAMDAAGSIAVTGSSTGAVHIWNLLTNSAIVRIWGHSTSLTAAAVHPDGVVVVTASQSGTLRFWDPSTGAMTGALHAHAGAVLAMAWLDATTLASVGADGLLRMWGGHPMQCVATANLRGAGVALATIPNATTFATLDTTGTVMVWEGPNAREIATIVVGHDAISVAITTDAEYVITGHEDGRLFVWHNPTAERVAHCVDSFPVRTMIALGPRSFAVGDWYSLRIVDIHVPGRPLQPNL